MIQNRPVRFRRGPVAALLNRVLSWGEPYVGEDEDRIFVGGKSSNIELLNKAEFTKHLEEEAKHVHRDDNPLSSKYQYVDSISYGLVSPTNGFPFHGTHLTVRLSDNYITQLVVNRLTGKMQTRSFVIANNAWTPFRTAISERKEYVLFDGALTNGSAALTIPNGIQSLSDFDELYVIGTLNSDASTVTRKHFCEQLYVKGINDNMSFSDNLSVEHPDGSKGYFWLQATITKSTNVVQINFNHKRTNSDVPSVTTDNNIAKIVGVRYE